MGAEPSSPDRRTLAAQELSALEAHFRYEDHRDFERSEYEPIARRLKRQGQWVFWLGAITGGVFTIWAMLQFIDYGADGETLDLILGIAMLAVGWAQQVAQSRQGMRLIVPSERMLALLEPPDATEPSAEEAPVVEAHRHWLGEEAYRSANRKMI